MYKAIGVRMLACLQKCIARSGQMAVHTIHLWLAINPAWNDLTVSPYRRILPTSIQHASCGDMIVGKRKDQEECIRLVRGSQYGVVPTSPA